MDIPDQLKKPQLINCFSAIVLNILMVATDPQIGLRAKLATSILLQFMFQQRKLKFRG